MGSKRKSCHQIKNVIIAHTKDKSIKTIVELFCGWFAVGEVFLKDWRKVIANDKNKYVVALIDQVINKWLDEKKCLERISREKFQDVIANPSKYDDWYFWYVQCIWSFGNNQKDYLFWWDAEKQKHSLFQLVVHKEVDEFVKSIMPQKYIDGILKQSDRHKARLALKKVIWVMWKWNVQLQSLERLENLERLERLQSLERLENKVILSSKSYEEVNIPSDAIVYCDPPYKWTAEYSEWAFNHTKFRQHMRDLSKTNQVFISEYTAPDDFKVIYEFEQKSCLSWKWTTDNQPTEKVFTIKKNWQEM